MLSAVGGDNAGNAMAVLAVKCTMPGIALQYVVRAQQHLLFALICAKLDSDLLDLDEEEGFVSGYLVPKNPNITIDAFECDDQAGQETRLKKSELWLLLQLFELDEEIWVPQNQNNPDGQCYLSQGRSY